MITVYLLLLKFRDNLDYNGTYFDMFMNLDFKNFMDKYFNFIENNPNILNKNHLNILENIWRYDDLKIRYVIKSILKINDYKRVNFLNLLFSNSKDNYVIEEKYLIEIIKSYSDREDILLDIFNVISNRSREGRIKCINELLNVNNNYEIFEKIRLEPCSWSWSGSEIPIIESRIDFFNELLSSIQNLGFNYIKHCMLIKERVKFLEIYKKKVIRDEFLRDW